MIACMGADVEAFPTAEVSAALGSMVGALVERLVPGRMRLIKSLVAFAAAGIELTTARKPASSSPPPGVSFASAGILAFAGFAAAAGAGTTGAACHAGVTLGFPCCTTGASCQLTVSSECFHPD